MSKGKRWIVASLILSSLIKVVLPSSVAGSSPGAPVFKYREMDASLEAKVEAALPEGVRMVDGAIAALAQGLGGMSPAEQALFEHYFDPAGTGEIDEAFVEAVVGNYRIVRGAFDNGLTVEAETENQMCYGKRLYYTEFVKVHLCPYFREEQDPERIARDFVHELVHIALLARDRVYYSPGSASYAELTPYGHWTSRLPLVGRIFQELTGRDTLYNPDTYSEFAYALSRLDGSGVAAAPVTAEAAR